MEEDLKNTSQNAKAWQNKAIALGGLGRKDEAKEANEEALAIFNHSLDRDPENVSLWKGKADVLAFLGRWEEALQAYSKVTEIDPEDYGAWGRKGEVLYCWRIRLFGGISNIGLAGRSRSPQNR